MARLVRYTLHALKRGTHRRGDVVTVLEGSDFDKQRKDDKAWTRTLMPAHTPTPGPAPDQAVQTNYRALLTFLREASARTSALEPRQREAYSEMLIANRREIGELLVSVLPVPRELARDEDDLDANTDEAPESRPSEAPAPDVQKPEHHPSFTDEERRRFFAALGEICADEEMDKDTAYALAETVLGRVRPSAMTTEARDAYLAWLATPEGRTAYATFAGEELIEEAPKAPEQPSAPRGELVLMLDAVISGADTSTTIEALVAAARSAGLSVPDALPRRRVDVASALRALAVPSTSPLVPPSPADLGDD